MESAKVNAVNASENISNCKIQVSEICFIKTMIHKILL